MLADKGVLQLYGSIIKHAAKKTLVNIQYRYIIQFKTAGVPLKNTSFIYNHAGGKFVIITDPQNY